MMGGVITAAVTRLKAALAATSGATLIGFIHIAVAAVMGTIRDRMCQQVLLWDFLSPAQRADVLAGTGALDCTAALQAAIDHGATLYSVANGYPRGGVVIVLPRGAIRFTEIMRKKGVSLKGEGRYVTLLMMSLNGGTGFKCQAAVSQSYVDQVGWLSDSGFSLIHNPAVVFNTPTILWNMTGFSRNVWRDIALSFGGNVTAVSMKGATLAGSNGPAQWYNDFYSVFVEGDGTGGIGWDLGDTDVNKEQITTWAWYGGRTSSNNASGIGMRWNSATGCKILGHVFESCSDQLIIGSAAGTRGCSHNYVDAYFEGATRGYTIYPNALATQIKGFATGVINTDNGVGTTRLSYAEVLLPVASTADSFIIKQISAAYKPQIKGSPLPGLRLKNDGGQFVDVQCAASNSSGANYFNVGDDLGHDLLKIGVASAQFHPAQLSIGNQSAVSIFMGAGTPEGVVAAGVGSLYMRTDGAAGTSLYVKQSGAANVGWVGK